MGRLGGVAPSVGRRKKTFYFISKHFFLTYYKLFNRVLSMEEILFLFFSIGRLTCFFLLQYDDESQTGKLYFLYSWGGNFGDSLSRVRQRILKWEVHFLFEHHNIFPVLWEVLGQSIAWLWKDKWKIVVSLSLCF